MRLADFIDDNIEPILQAWEDFARTLKPASEGMNAEALRDHAEQMLRTIAADLRTPQTRQQRIARSHGEAPGMAGETAAETHAIIRQSSGFTVDQMVSEYRALRTSVLMLWMPRAALADEHAVADVMRFNEAVDQALAESIVSYSAAVDAARNIFLGILGHDLRSPLGAILLSSEVLLRASDLPARTAKIASRIYTSVKRASKIANDLLDFTRTQLGAGIPVQRLPGDLVSICESMVEEARAYHPESEIIFETSGAIRGQFDQARMEQMIANLIGNAIQHGDNNLPVTVSLKSEGNMAIIVVNNQGTPIEKEVLANIFDPMVRRVADDEAQYGAGAGLGLGLYIASAIVSAHQGRIGVRSTAVAGTTFTVRIPLDPVP